MKTYAKNLVDGLLDDTINKAASDAEEKASNLAAGDETDVSISLNTEDQDQVEQESTQPPPSSASTDNAGETGKNSDDLKRAVSALSPSISSHVETDSLDETSEKHQHPAQNYPF